MIEEIKKIRGFQKKPDGIFGSYMTRPVSHIVAYAAKKLGLSPNMVSFISFLLCMASVLLIYFFYDIYHWLLVSAAIWWLGAILDAADGDLARYANKTSDFGKWFDSYLDRIKEFMIFSVMGLAAYKIHGSQVYLLLGFLSIFSNVMSGYISNTKDLFVRGRSPEIVLGKRYLLGMVDTRDFFVILSLAANDLRLVLFCYSTVFFIVLWVQTFLFIRKYHRHK